ncbi:MAG: hypothetical protein J6V23_06985 [Bacteroidaceae bacterium]|nr:hypothetical protein [Bacteroidaceae bacterium]
MKERERLIELMYKQFSELYKDGDWNFNEMLGGVANYLLANGVIVPPCKVGDKVYYISENPLNLSVQANTLYEADVVRIVTTRLGTSLVIQIHNEYGCTEIPDVNEWGKTVFLSKEEFTKRYLDTTDLEKAVQHLTRYKELKEAEQASRKEDEGK